MNETRLVVATGDYAHTRGLGGVWAIDGAPGRVVAEHVTKRPGAIFARALAESMPALVPTVADRFGRAKEAAQRWLLDTDASCLPLPLHHGWAEACFGAGEPWPEGVDANRGVLDAFAGHMHEQGLTRERIRPDDVYRPG